MKMKKPLILMAFGFLLITISFLSPLVTTIIDDTPPVVSSTIPKNGTVYQYLALLDVRCRDPETGIAWIHYTDNSPEMISLGKDVSLTYRLMLGEDEAWESTRNDISPEFPEYDSFPGVYTPGIYNFQYEISNNNGNASLTTTISGTYTIYTPLEGEWYINDILITAPTQTLRFDARTLNFKFVMTAGGTVVSTSVAWSGGDTGSISLTETALDTWEGSITFSHGGTYTIELRASDGTTDVVMAIVPIKFPSGEVTVIDVPLLAIAGGGFIIVGVGVWINKRKSTS